MFEKNKIELLAQKIATCQKAIIVTHQNPDADALGSSFAWKSFLEKKGLKVEFISPTFFTDSLRWMQGVESTFVFEDYKHKKFCTTLIEKTDLIFCLDFNAISRLDDLGLLIQEAAAFKIMIDHHREPESFADLAFSDFTYGATCEMLVAILDQLNELDKIDLQMAENLYTGIATDTGFFQFSNATPNVHKVIGFLIGKGVSPEYISDKINSTFREDRLRYFGFALDKKLKVVNEGKVAYILISENEAREHNVQLGENEGLVNYPFKIESVKVSVLFSEEKGKVKISFRSKEQYDVSSFARNYFEGGGHRNAAGGKSMLSLMETEQKFISLVSEIFQQ